MNDVRHKAFLKPPGRFGSAGRFWCTVPQFSCRCCRRSSPSAARLGPISPICPMAKSGTADTGSTASPTAFSLGKYREFCSSGPPTPATMAFYSRLYARARARGHRSGRSSDVAPDDFKSGKLEPGPR
jgi:hypothetical protein